jgi:hypothetical protein
LGEVFCNGEKEKEMKLFDFELVLFEEYPIDCFEQWLASNINITRVSQCLEKRDPREIFNLFKHTLDELNQIYAKRLIFYIDNVKRNEKT